MREHCVPMNRWYRFLLWLLLLVWVNRLVVRSETTANTDTDSEDNDKYLYHTEEARGIIIDYEPPPTTNDGGAKDEDPHGDRPDFIYGPNQGPRVVEFYAPWCPHVRSFVRSLARSFDYSSRRDHPNGKRQNMHNSRRTSSFYMYI